MWTRYCEKEVDFYQKTDSSPTTGPWAGIFDQKIVQSMLQADRLLQSYCPNIPSQCMLGTVCERQDGARGKNENRKGRMMDLCTTFTDRDLDGGVVFPTAAPTVYTPTSAPAEYIPPAAPAKVVGGCSPQGQHWQLPLGAFQQPPLGTGI